MIASRQQSIHWLFRLYDALNRGYALQNKCRKALAMIISPEDSTGESQVPAASYHGSNFLGSVKALFWMAAAISLSVLIGQLH